MTANDEAAKIARYERGLTLLGWRVDQRVTSDEEHALQELADHAVVLADANSLDAAECERLSLEAFTIFEFQVMNVQERALMTGAVYPESPHMRDSAVLVDEAFLCYARGYYVAALALLFVIVEQYLLRAYGWQEGVAKPSFKQLRLSIRSFPNTRLAADAEVILEAVYGWYTKSEDSPFGFNRHAVHHGLRPFSSADKMNCVRCFLLLDLLVQAEGLTRGFHTEAQRERITQRVSVYEQATSFAREVKLIRPGDEHLHPPSA